MPADPVPLPATPTPTRFVYYGTPPTPTPTLTPTVTPVPGGNFIVENIPVPAPPPEAINEIFPFFTDVTDTSHIQYLSDVFGECGDTSQEEQEACACYTYAAVYTAFLYYTGRAPTIWDMLSAIYHLELGEQGEVTFGLEAFARNFFDPQQGGCRYINSQYFCNYEYIIHWLGQTAWIQASARDTQSGHFYSNVQRALGLNSITIRALTRQRDQISQFSTNQMHDEIGVGDPFNVGMFRYDVFVRNEIEANITAWSTGQGGDVPSRWGNQVLPSGTTNFPTTSERPYVSIKHFFYYGGRTFITQNANVVFGDDISEMNAITAAGLTLPTPLTPPGCTEVFAITTSDGALPTLSTCPR